MGRRARRRALARSARCRCRGTPTRMPAIARAHDQFRWFAGGWAVNADLPTTAGFAAASQFVRPEDVAEAIACGPDLDGARAQSRRALSSRPGSPTSRSSRSATNCRTASSQRPRSLFWTRSVGSDASRSPTRLAPGAAPSVSVVIPVLDDRSELARCLAALRRQTRHPDEIIVVDNGSTDGSDSAARAAGATLVRCTDPGSPPPAPAETTRRPAT